MATESPCWLIWGKWCLHLFLDVFDPVLLILAGNEDMHKISDEFEFRPDQTTDYGVSCPWVSKIFPIDLKWENGVCMLAHSFLIKPSSKLLVTRTGIKARMSLISGLWFPWPICMFFEMRFDLGTLDSGERSVPFGLLVYVFPWHWTLYALYLCMPWTLFVNRLNNNNEPDLWFGQYVYLSVTKVKVRK